MSTLFIAVLAATTSFLFASTNAVTTRTVHQFPKPTWLENIAAMRNGSLLVTIVGRPEVHVVNTLVTPSTAFFIASIPDVNAVFGITELSNDVFAVAAGNYTSTNAPVPGSFSVWSIDLSHHTESAKVEKVADAPGVGMINGLATLNKHTLLLADSWAGNIASLDITTGKTGVWLEDESTASNFSAAGLPLGVNGIKVHREYVYYTNTVQSSLSRVRVDASIGKVIGKVETLAQGEVIAVPDDFAVLEDGSVILGRPLSNELIEVSTNDKARVLIKGAIVESVTAVALGRSKGDKRVVYLSSMGGFDADGGAKAGGKVVAIQLR